MMFASDVWLERAFKQKDISRWLAQRLSELVGPRIALPCATPNASGTT